MSHDDSRAARQSTEVLHLTEAEVAVHSGTKHPEGEVSKSTMPEMTKIVLHAVPSLAQTAQGDKAQVSSITTASAPAAPPPKAKAPDFDLLGGLETTLPPLLPPPQLMPTKLSLPHRMPLTQVTISAILQQLPKPNLLDSQLRFNHRLFKP